MKIITVRDGKPIRLYSDETPVKVETMPARAAKPTVRKNRWLEAERKPAPARKDLTKRQWSEYGELVKMAKGLEFINPRECSLQDLRDVHKSTIRLQTHRLIQMLN